MVCALEAEAGDGGSLSMEVGQEPQEEQSEGAAASDGRQEHEGRGDREGGDVEESTESSGHKMELEST